MSEQLIEEILDLKTKLVEASKRIGDLERDLQKAREEIDNRKVAAIDGWEKLQQAERERDEARIDQESARSDYYKCVEAKDQATQQATRYRKALYPFARLGQRMTQKELRYDTPLVSCEGRSVSGNDFRAARKALDPEGS